MRFEPFDVAQDRPGETIDVAHVHEITVLQDMMGIGARRLNPSYESSERGIELVEAQKILKELEEVVQELIGHWISEPLRKKLCGRCLEGFR
jgi:hypothetical protein